MDTKTPSPKIILAKWLFIFTGIIIFTFTGMQEVAIALTALVICNVGYGQDLKLIAENNVMIAIISAMDLMSKYSDTLTEKVDALEKPINKKAVKH